MNILAIDIGSSATKVAVASFDGEQIKLLGVATTNTSGIKSGKITSIQEASNSIRNAVKNAKENLSLDVDKVVVSVSGAYTNSLTGFSELMLDSSNSQIKIEDISKAIENAKISAGIPKDQIAIHILPFRFKANSTDNIEDPLDMRASSLRLEANIITMNKNDYENIKQILALADINNYELVSSIYANAIYCLNNDEKESGVAIIDCGAQVCDIAIYSFNSLVWMGYFPFGSAHITSDIAKCLTSTNEMADKIKLQFSLYSNEENTAVEYFKTGSNTLEKVSIQTIVKCVDMRLDEMLECIYASIEDSQYEKYFSSFVLTGGCFKINNIAEKAFPKFNNKAVRTKIEKNRAFFDDRDIYTQPEFTCLLGLCMYASGYHTKYELNSNGKLLIKQKNNEFSIIKKYETFKSNQKHEEKFSLDTDNQKKEQVLLDTKSEKDEILASIQLDKNEIAKEGIFKKISKSISNFLDRIL